MSVLAECPLCKGRRACPECDGFGEHECPECRGRDEECISCSGIGSMICPHCQGQGVCPRCRGEGTIANKELSSENEGARGRKNSPFIDKGNNNRLNGV